MKRKVSQIGPSTLMVSLPTKWVKEHNVRKGDELDVSTEQNQVYFSITERKVKNRKCTLDISQFSQYSLARYLEMCYIHNYNEISLFYQNTEIANVKGKSKKIQHYIKNLTNQFIGMEIISQTAQATELQCFSLSDEDTPDKIEKRIFFLWNEYVGEFLQALREGIVPTQEEMQDKHDTLERFIKYFLRVLLNSERTEAEKIQLYSFYTSLSPAVDRFKFIAEMLRDKKWRKELYLHLEEFFMFISHLFTALHKNKMDPELEKERYRLIQSVISTQKFSSAELKVLFEARLLLDVYGEFYRVMIIRNLRNLDHKLARE